MAGMKDVMIKTIFIFTVMWCAVYQIYRLSRCNCDKRVDIIVIDDGVEFPPENDALISDLLVLHIHKQ